MQWDRQTARRCPRSGRSVAFGRQDELAAMLFPPDDPAIVQHRRKTANSAAGVSYCGQSASMQTTAPPSSRADAGDADALLLAVHWLRTDDVLQQAGDLSRRSVVGDGSQGDRSDDLESVDAFVWTSTKAYPTTRAKSANRLFTNVIRQAQNLEKHRGLRTRTEICFGGLSRSSRVR